MSLVPVTVDIYRKPGTEDPYGGETGTATAVYTNLQAWVNYPQKQAVDRSESVTTQGAMAGPGVETRTKGVCKFEPIPLNVTIRVNDEVRVHSGDNWLVVGVRTYEYTLQLNMDLILP